MRRALLCLLVLAAACGDDGSDPGNGAAGSGLHFAGCGRGSFECASLTVPADYSQPDGDKLSLLVLRSIASDQANRLGVLTFNFGGPGGQTLEPIADNFPLQPIATTTELSSRFDWVLMDWRGVDTSAPELTCLDSTTKRALAQQTFAPATDDQWAELFQLTHDVAAGCVANGSNAPLLAHQDTESAARDFDALREGLGEDKLNMWVVSYGSRLGAMYASLFPDRVRAIAIDSPLGPAPQYEQDLADQSNSFEAELGRFFSWCAAASTASCPFRTADGSAASVAAAYEQLLTSADAAPIITDGVTLSRDELDLAAIGMMYFPDDDWPTLAKALSLLAQGSGAEMAQLVLANAIDSASDDNAFSSYQNVESQDMPLPAAIAAPDAYRAWAESLAADAPHVGLQNAAAQAFATDWPSTIPAQHAIGGTTASPLLITATVHDPATPYPGAAALQAVFPGAYLATYEGDGHANGGAKLCLGNLTAAYLLDPTTPPAVTDCPDEPPTGTASAARYRPGRAWKLRPPAARATR